MTDTPKTAAEVMARALYEPQAAIGEAFRELFEESSLSRANAQIAALREAGMVIVDLAVLKEAQALAAWSSPAWDLLEDMIAASEDGA